MPAERTVIMNIGIDIRALMAPQRTGVGEYTYELLNALFSLDTENEYFLFYNSFVDVSQYIPKWEQENVHYVATRWPNKLFNTSVRLLKIPTFDSLTTHQQWNNPPACLASKRAGEAGRTVEQFELDYFFSPNLNFTALTKNVKHILTIHDLSFEFFHDCFSWKQRLWHRLVRPRKQCERAHRILTPSENTKRDVVEYYGVPEEKVKVVRPGIAVGFREQGIRNKEQLKKKYRLPEKFFLFLGTIEPRKNILGIIQAYRAYCSLFPDSCSLVIAGAPGWNNLAIMRAIYATPNVHYIGYIEPADKSALYQLARVFVYPSLYEGFGLPVLEAMASGTPVITSNRSSLVEVAGEAGYLVNPYNTTEIARGMEVLTHDESLRAILIEKGYKKLEHYSWQRSAKDFLRIL